MVKQNGTRWDGIENRKQCDALRLCKYVCKYTCISTSVITHKGWHVHLCQFVSLGLLYLSVPLSNRLHPSIHPCPHSSILTSPVCLASFCISIFSISFCLAPSLALSGCRDLPKHVSVSIVQNTLASPVHS